jgi:hypothetical protein
LKLTIKSFSGPFVGDAKVDRSKQMSIKTHRIDKRVRPLGVVGPLLNVKHWPSDETNNIRLDIGVGQLASDCLHDINPDTSCKINTVCDKHSLVIPGQLLRLALLGKGLANGGR